MKKLLALTITLILALAIPNINALSSPAASDITGTWYFNAVEVAGVVMTLDTGIEMAVIFAEDHTVLKQKTGEGDVEGTWAIEGSRIIINAGDTPEYFTLSDGKLITEGYGMKVIYGREKPTYEPVELSPVRADAALEDFDGDWTGYALYMDGQMVPLVMALIFDASLEIDGGNITYSIASDTLFKRDYTGNIEGDALIAATQEDVSDDMATLTLSIREDGTLSADFPDDVYMLFKKR